MQKHQGARSTGNHVISPKQHHKSLLLLRSSYHKLSAMAPTTWINAAASADFAASHSWFKSNWIDFQLGNPLDFLREHVFWNAQNPWDNHGTFPTSMKILRIKSSVNETGLRVYNRAPTNSGFVGLVLKNARTCLRSFSEFQKALLLLLESCITRKNGRHRYRTYKKEPNGNNNTQIKERREKKHETSQTQKENLFSTAVSTLIRQGA